MNHYLAIDVGTTSLKGALIDQDGALIAASTSSYSTRRPKPNHVVQDPEDWWQALKNVAGELNRTFNLDSVRAVGLSGMAATHVLIDWQGEVIAPAIIWQDTRAEREAKELASAFVDADKVAIFGANVGITASTQAARMLWLHRHQPTVLDQARAVLGSKDYLAFRLTGEVVTDVTSSSTFANLASGELDERVAELTGFDPSKLPQRLAPYGLAGTVGKPAAEATGLRAGTPVAIGMIDSWCNILGSGLARPGDAFDVAGTAEVVGLADSRDASAPAPKDAVYRLPFLTGIDVVYGVTQCGTDSLTWFAEAFGDLERERANRGEPSLFEQLTALADAVPNGADGLLFLPYLEGERSPFNDPRMRGGFLGVQRRHRKGHFARAVLEGVAYSVKHVLEACETACGTRALQVRTSSGGAKSRLWNGIKANVLGRSVARLRVNDAGAVGAAILAAVAVGDVSLEDGVRELVHVVDEIEPEVAVHAHYRELYQLYLAAGTGSSELMHGLSGAAEKVSAP